MDSNKKIDPVIKQEKDEFDDILEKALEGADDKLNLTADESIDDEKLAPELEKEYEAFMKDLNKEANLGDENTVNELSSFMANLLSGLKNDPDMKDVGANKMDENQIKEAFSKMMSNEGSDNNIDDVAQKLLKEFMDKDILQEPLQEAEKNYLCYLQEKGNTLNETDKKNYEAQLACVRELLETLDKTPDNKDKMIEIFEKMHDYGLQPEGVLNPLSKIPGMPSQMTQNFGPQDPNEMIGNLEKMMGQNGEGCNIF